MPRIRNIKPDFFTDADLLELSPLHRLLFQGLWCWADREGRLEDKPRELKLRILPADPADVDAMLSDLERAAKIIRYEAGGKRLIQVPGFPKHQRCHKDEKPSELPPPDVRQNPPEPFEAGIAAMRSAGEKPHATTSPPTPPGNFPVKSPETETETEAGERRRKPENRSAAPSAPVARVGSLRDGIERLFHESRGAEFSWANGGERKIGLLLKHGEAEILRRWEIALGTRYPRCSSIGELVANWDAYAAPEAAAPSNVVVRDRQLGRALVVEGFCAVCDEDGEVVRVWGQTLCRDHGNDAMIAEVASAEAAIAWVAQRRAEAA